MPLKNIKGNLYQEPYGDVYLPIPDPTTPAETYPDAPDTDPTRVAHPVKGKAGNIAWGAAASQAVNWTE